MQMTHTDPMMERTEVVLARLKRVKFWSSVRAMVVAVALTTMLLWLGR